MNHWTFSLVATHAIQNSLKAFVTENPRPQAHSEEIPFGAEIASTWHFTGSPEEIATVQTFVIPLVFHTTNRAGLLPGVTLFKD